MTDTQELIKKVQSQRWATIEDEKLSIKKEWVEEKHGEFIRSHEAEIIAAINESEAAWEIKIAKAHADKKENARVKAEKEAAIIQATSIETPEDQEKVDYHAGRISVERDYYDCCADDFFIAHKNIIWDRYIAIEKAKRIEKEEAHQKFQEKRSQEHSDLDWYTRRELAGLED